MVKWYCLITYPIVFLVGLIYLRERYSFNEWYQIMKGEFI